MQPATLAKRLRLPLLLITLVFYFYGLGAIPLVSSDEPRYAEVAREMLARRDPVTPTLGGHLWFEKPPLLYWMEMASFAAFGVSEWSVRAGTALCGVLNVLILYWMASRVEKADEDAEGLPVWTGAALAACAANIVFSRAATTDIVLTTTVTTALASLFVSEIEEDARRRRWLLLGFHAAVGLSLLAKGLVGIIIPYGVAASYFLLKREWPRRDFILSLVWGLPVTILIAATWYWPVTARNGWAFIDQFIIQHHFARFVSNKFHHPQRFYFYLEILPALVLPWMIYFFSELLGARRWNFRDATPLGRLRVFAVAWLALPIIFFTLSVSKLPAYILPVVPAAAILIGDRLNRFVKGDGALALARATGTLLLLCAVAILIYNARAHFATWPRALFICVPLLAVGILSIFSHRRELCVVSTCCAIFLTGSIAISWGAQKVASRESVRDLLQAASAKGYDAAPLYQLHEVEHTSEFYAAGRLAYAQSGDPLKLEDISEVILAASSREGAILILVPSRFAYQLYNSPRIAAELISDDGAFSIFAVRKR